MFEKSLPFEDIWHHSKDQMLIRWGFLVKCPDDFPEVDDNFNSLTSDQICKLFDKMLALPTLHSQEPDMSGAKAYFTVVRNPYLVHVYIGVDHLNQESITFEFYKEFVSDKWDESEKEGCGSADVNTIKRTINMIEKNEDPFNFLRDNAIEWGSHDDE